jgi:hypothetical protein
MVKNWPLHHDKAPSHVSFFTRELFTKSNMIVIPCPPYLPDLAPCYFCRYHHSETVEVIEAESQVMLNTLTEHGFQDAFKRWQKCWEWCICVKGNYFEGYGGQ